MTEVTAAIIYKDDRILMCQRPKGKRCELLWEFPGGKLEKDETLENCIIRECREELDVSVIPEHIVGAVEYDYGDISVRITFFLCSVYGDSPKCIEHNSIDWLSFDEISKLELCPADREMLNLYADKIKKLIISQ